MPFIALALIIAAALGGGTSLAAQASLPGDALWDFKVAVNERIAESVAVGEQAKADADINLLQARLSEAAKLSAEGNLNAEAQAKIESNFDAHAKAVAKHVAALQTKGQYAAAADVAARFQATVAGNVSVLTGARAAADESGQAALTSVLGRVQTTLSTASSLSAQASAEAAAHPGSSTSASTNANATADISAEGSQDGVQVDANTNIDVAI